MCDKDGDGNKVWDCGKCDCLTSFAKHNPVTQGEIRVCSKCDTRL
jgi:uncharacterized paraquat-inducible protein A